MRKLCYPALIILLMLPVSSQAVAPFNNPECAVYHPGTDRYFISNEGDGTIVQIDANRDTTYFSTELPLAVGMTIRGDTLYVSATPDGIVGFDLTGDAIALVIPVPGHTRLNDVCADSSGNLWVTDPQGANIFKVHIESRTSTLVASGVTMVNGIHYDHGNHRLLLNQWIPDTPIQAMDPDNYSLTTVLPTTGYDNLNGLTDDDLGNFYISAWGPRDPYTLGVILKYDPAFSEPPEIFSSPHHGAGDMCYNRHDSTMVIPNVRGQTVDFIPDPYRYDDDSDGHANALDNCPTLYNPGQEDADGDALGDTCDNCPGNYNPEQEDIDNDGIGDVCETNRSWYVRQDGIGVP
ncbi:SMP-30/gluconolactonase/LRE family protein [Candidatus Zixiibacteriota bacterium]